MRKLLLAVAMIGGIAFAPAASALDAQSAVTGPQGQTATRSGTASCEGGNCTRSGTATGPQGQTATRSGTANCEGGNCTRSGTATGPQGQTVTRNRSVTRTAPGQWSGQRSATGPRGGTATRSGTVQRGW